MRQELDKLLCEKYPKMMVNRHASVQETAMCWGFSCGDGWYNILNALMGNIQGHIDWKNKKEEVVPQVTLDQIKEKFGTLRFYYSGGDDVIDGMVRMAESMTEVTCEECGNVGERRGGGWVHTYCTPCEEARELARQKANEEYEFKKILKEGNEQ
jgi:hypothetical protein